MSKPIADSNAGSSSPHSTARTVTTVRKPPLPSQGRLRGASEGDGSKGDAETESALPPHVR